MAEYLIDNPPRVRQFRRPRSQQPSGVIVVHTAESFPDETPPDTGAENVARFIRDRTTPGSYHDLADSDSIVFLVPYDAEAFGDGTGSNPHAYHVSAATQAHRWGSLSQSWTDDCVRNMAKAAARYARWLKDRRGITIPARRISRAQSDARMPGFISHAERDPNRRTDPGTGFPWAKFLSYYAAEMSGTEEDDMPYRDWPQADKDALTQDIRLEFFRAEVGGVPFHELLSKIADRSLRGMEAAQAGEAEDIWRAEISGEAAHILLALIGDRTLTAKNVAAQNNALLQQVLIEQGVAEDKIDAILAAVEQEQPAELSVAELAEQLQIVAKSKQPSA